MNRLRFDVSAWMPQANWRSERQRLSRLLHQYAESRGFAHQFEELSQYSRPDVVRTDRERCPRRVFVGNVRIASLAGPAASAIYDIRYHLHDFHQCVRWGVAGLFVIATNSLEAALGWAPALESMAASDGLTAGEVANFQIESVGQSAWIVISHRLERSGRYCGPV